MLSSLLSRGLRVAQCRWDLRALWDSGCTPVPDLCRTETSIKVHRQWDRNFSCSTGCWQPHKEGEEGDLGHMVPEATCTPCCSPQASFSSSYLH